VIEQGNTVYTEVHTILKDKESLVRQRISVLDLKERRDIFSSEEGAHINYEISKEYVDIQKKIFGVHGYSFVKYLMRHARKMHQQFAAAHKKWEDTYHSNGKVNSLTLSWACRDAATLRVDWDTAHASVALIYDFF